MDRESKQDTQRRVSNLVAECAYMAATLLISTSGTAAAQACESTPSSYDAESLAALTQGVEKILVMLGDLSGHLPSETIVRAQFDGNALLRVLARADEDGAGVRLEASMTTFLDAFGCQPPFPELLRSMRTAASTR